MRWLDSLVLFLQFFDKHNSFKLYNKKAIFAFSLLTGLGLVFIYYYFIHVHVRVSNIMEIFYFPIFSSSFK